MILYLDFDGFLDLGGLQVELEDLLGIRVDVRTPKDLPMNFRSAVVAEAVPVRQMQWEYLLHLSLCGPVHRHTR